MPVGAMIGTGIAGAAANVVAGGMQARAADKASKLQTQMYQQTRDDLSPYRTAGEQGANALMAALPELTGPITLDQNWLQSTPGYQFNLRQGLKGVQSSAAARGLGTSGAALRGAAQYATGLADSTYQQQVGNELAQREARYNRLLSAAQLGGNAAAQTGQNALATGQQISNNLIGGAAAQGAGLVGAGNALTGAGRSWLGYDLGQQQLASGRNLYAPTNPTNYLQFGMYGSGNPGV